MVAYDLWVEGVPSLNCLLFIKMWTDNSYTYLLPSPLPVFLSILESNNINMEKQKVICNINMFMFNKHKITHINT